MPLQDIDGEEFMAICDGYGISKASGLEEVLSTDLFALDDGAIYPIYNNLIMGHSAENGEKYITNDIDRLEGWMRINNKKLSITKYVRI